MADTFRALCAELVDAWDATADFDFNDFGHAAAPIVSRARAALAETDEPAVPAPAADGEVAECAAELLLQMEDLAADAVAGLRYIEESCGRLYGVGWDRVYGKADRLKPAHALPLPLPEVNNG